MGIVYKAQDLKLDRLVALKFLPQQITISEVDKARFLQEAKAASAVMHPNVCVIYDIQEEDGQQFIVMEYVEGKTLTKMVPIQKLQDAIGYAIQIGEALQEAHSKGVVHRDIKTDNIMVNTKNQVKVMDFGLAKLKGSLKLTKTSSTVGTLSYMAPEQIQGGEVDARSDIFSFGVVLYEMLTGHLPFRGEHEAAMVYSIVNEEPEPIQKYRPEISSEVLHILNRSLEKDPEDRYQYVHDMVIDLKRAKKETSKVFRTTPAPVIAEHDSKVAAEEHRPPSVKRHKVRSPLLVLIGLIGIIAIMTLIGIRILVSTPVPKLNPNMSFRQLEIPFTQISYPSLSHDGNWIAFGASDGDNKWSVYFMNATKGSPKKLVTEPLHDIEAIDISPDGSEILYDCRQSNKPRSIHVISSSGGPSRKIAEPGTWAKWRPDGNRIGYIIFEAKSQSGKREFWTIRPDGSDNRIEFIDSLRNYWGSYCFDWSPDGKAIAWLRSFSDYGEIIIRDLASGEERKLTSYHKPIDEIAWSTNNQIFFSSSKGGNTNIWMIPVKGGESVQVTRGTGPDTGMRISGNNQRLLYLNQRFINNVWTADVNGSNVRQLTFDDQQTVTPTFSPDKKRIAFSMGSPEPLTPGYQIFIMQSDGTNRMQLPTGEGRYMNTSWSPDGKYMTYSLWAPYDSAKVYLIETANPGAPKLIGKGEDIWWLDAQKFITIAPYPNIYSSLYTVDQSEPIKVSEDFTCEFSLPDGKHILVGYSKKGQEGWWLKDTGLEQKTGSKRMLSAEYFNSAWPSVSLGYLLYLKPNGEVWRISLTDGNQQRLPQIFNGLNPFNKALQLGWDDQQVVFLKGRSDSGLVIIENLFR